MSDHDHVFDLPVDRSYVKVYKETTPDILKAYAGFEDAVFAREGREIPLKYRQLIAFAVGVTTQCVYCIDSHSKAAVAEGATETELAETAWVATAIRAGGGYAHGRLGFKLSGVHEH
jgi:AhpD family alkylhydroperoxidase